MIKLVLVVRAVKGSAKSARKGETVKLYNSGFSNFI